MARELLQVALYALAVIFLSVTVYKARSCIRGPAPDLWPELFLCFAVPGGRPDEIRAQHLSRQSGLQSDDRQQLWACDARDPLIPSLDYSFQRELDPYPAVHACWCWCPLM